MVKFILLTGVSLIMAKSVSLYRKRHPVNPRINDESPVTEITMKKSGHCRLHLYV
jgi:hypothetical protein